MDIRVDETVAVAQSLRPDVRIVTQSGKGKGNAMADGFAACTGDIIVMLDADGSTDAAEIPRFVSALRNGADFVKGSRFAQGGSSADITFTRGLGNHVLRTIVNALYGTNYTDLCYGYNAFWARCLPYMRVDCDGFEVETLINVRIAKAGLIVHEVPSYENIRLHGSEQPPRTAGWVPRPAHDHAGAAHRERRGGRSCRAVASRLVGS